MTTKSIRERVSRLAGLLARECEALAEFIAELADFDLRLCWEELGYPSLFEFLVRELRLSRGNAFYRTKAVDLVRRFPEVLEALREGKLCLSCIPEVARVLTPENRAEALPRFFHLSREYAKLVSAELAPREVVPVREVVTSAVPIRTVTPPAPALALALPPGQAPSPSPVQLLNSDDPKVLERTGQVPVAVEPDATEPMTAQLARLHLTVTRELLAKIEAAQLALSHARPGATIADILELGADTALAQDARRKGLVKRPRPPNPALLPPDSDRHPASLGGGRASASCYIPAEIRRAVWERDHRIGGRARPAAPEPEPPARANTAGARPRVRELRARSWRHVRASRFRPGTREAEVPGRVRRARNRVTMIRVRPPRPLRAGGSGAGGSGEGARSRARSRGNTVGP